MGGKKKETISKDDIELTIVLSVTLSESILLYKGYNNGKVENVTFIDLFEDFFRLSFFIAW